jgi:hypothetical protein
MNRQAKQHLGSLLIHTKFVYSFKAITHEFQKPNHNKVEHVNEIKISKNIEGVKMEQRIYRK